jgi:hypothetical protein
MTPPTEQIIGQELLAHPRGLAAWSFQCFFVKNPPRAGKFPKNRLTLFPAHITIIIKVIKLINKRGKIMVNLKKCQVLK